MSDNQTEAEEKMAKAIFISGDGWLAVFDLLPPSQLGLGIALISHRFDFYVDEHFKTRKWTLLKPFLIQSKNGENGTKEMEIASYEELLPIPQIQMPRKVIGFRCIVLYYIDRNAIAFLHGFRQLFASCPINLYSETANERISEFFLRNIWPMIAKNICGMHLFPSVFHSLRKFAPSFLNDCPSLRFIFFNDNKFFFEFSADDSAMASDAKAMAKWFFTPRPYGVPKVFKCELNKKEVRNWPSKIAAFKAAFDDASAPANAIVVIWFPPSFVDSVVPFDQTNKLTRERLALKRANNDDDFLLVRCPIVRDTSKWAKWEKEAIDWRFINQWNKIGMRIDDENDIGDGLLDKTPGPRDL
ncbi:hypothetical protein niasHT_033879 [Heterodera trifolii]|uniref:Uncharacterized protein n=1 Tax=Heterodera trifolii TaxID=157864 RepID=A0ABD2IBU4_9BILA